MGWLRNIVSVALPGIPQSIDAVNDVVSGKVPALPKNPLPLPDGVVDHLVNPRLQAIWDENRHAEADKLNGMLRDARKSIGDFISGAQDILSGDFSQGLHNIADSATRGVSAGAGAAMLDLRRHVSAVQMLTPIERAGRGLTGPERAYLDNIFKGSVDLDAIRIKEGSAGVGSIGNDHPFTSGNLIYTKKSPDSPEGWDAGLSEADRRKKWLELLAHEVTHVWQFQHFGSSYQANSLAHQLTGGLFEFEGEVKPTKDKTPGKTEYNWMIGMDEGKSWRQLNVEQQAKLVEMAAKAGMFEDETAIFMDDQGKNRTAYIRAAITQLRAGNG
jgi:hypothetical protein